MPALIHGKSRPSDFMGPSRTIEERGTGTGEPALTSPDVSVPRPSGT
jgi:hypothetical protein